LDMEAELARILERVAGRLGALFGLGG
jgi:hypothetical protein